MITTAINKAGADAAMLDAHESFQLLLEADEGDNDKDDADEALFRLQKPEASKIPYAKSLLCASFLAMNNTSYEKILLPNMKYTVANNHACDWIVIFYNNDNPSLLYRLRLDSIKIGVNLIYTEIHPYVSDPFLERKERLVKPVLLYRLMDYMLSYHRIWLIDEDIQLQGFKFQHFYNLLSSTYHPPHTNQLLPPLLIQPLIRSEKNNHVCEYNLHKSWSNYSSNNNSGSSSSRNQTPEFIKSKFVQLQSPIVDSEFLYWFLDIILRPMLPTITLLEAYAGVEHIWCGAADTYRKLQYLNLMQSNHDTSNSSSSSSSTRRFDSRRSSKSGKSSRSSIINSGGGSKSGSNSNVRGRSSSNNNNIINDRELCNISVFSRLSTESKSNMVNIAAAATTTAVCAIYVDTNNSIGHYTAIDDIARSNNEYLYDLIDNLHNHVAITLFAKKYKSWFEFCDLRGIDPRYNKNM
jgi:uncharacterized membrane protein YgcG